MLGVPAVRELKVFLTVWFGQLLSQIGSGLTGFALGIWVYQRTGSATLFALISLFTTLPGIVLSPLAGAFVDRWDRRWVMLVSDCTAGMSTLIIAFLLVAGQLHVWHIYLAMGVNSTCTAFQWLAYAAATTLLVPKHQLGRASGIVQLGEAVARIVAPVLAGALLVIIQIQGVLLIDFATYLFALVTLLSVRFPKVKTTGENHGQKRLLWREAVFGWTYITARPGLLGLLLLFAASNFGIGIVTVLITPMVLAFASSTTLGTVLSIGGSGMLVGSLVMSVWGGPRRGVYGVLGFGFLQGVCMLLAGLRPSIPLIAAAAFGGFLCYPIIGGCSQAIWQRKVPPEVQGRVFAVRRAIALSSMPLAFLLAGPLADHVFEPLLVINGPLSGTLGGLIGVGPGRGVGLLFMVLGTLSVLVILGGYMYPRLRLVEEELPDAISP